MRRIIKARFVPVFAAAALTVAVGGVAIRAADPLELPEKDYTKLLRSPLRKETKTHGLKIEVAYVADGFRYQMALGLNELRAAKRSGKKLSDKKLERAIKNLYLKAKRLKDKGVVVVDLARSGRDRHFFQKPATEHFYLSSPAMKKSTTTLAQSPKTLRPAIWQVWESHPKKDQRTRRIGRAFQTFVKRKLTPFETYQAVLATKPPGRVDQGLLTVRITGLVRAQSHGASSRGINERKKQISCRQFVDLVIPELRCQFQRERWKAPDDIEAFDYWVTAVSKL